MAKEATVLPVIITATSTVVIILGRNGMLLFTVSLELSWLLVLFANAFADKDKDKLWIKICKLPHLLLLWQLIIQVKCMVIPHIKLLLNTGNQLNNNQWTMATVNQQLITNSLVCQRMVSSLIKLITNNLVSQHMVNNLIKQVTTNNLYKTTVNEWSIVFEYFHNRWTKYLV